MLEREGNPLFVKFQQVVKVQIIVGDSLVFLFHSIGRVGENQVRFFSFHQFLIGGRVRGIATQ